MQAWTLAGIRVDIELAVALEVGVLELSRADTAAELDLAIAFNRDLWRLVGSIAVTAPRADDRSQLGAAAVRLADGWPADFTEANRRFAGLLAGRVSSAGTLRGLMDEWRGVRMAQPDLQFGAWLLGRMVCVAGKVDGRLAA